MRRAVRRKKLNAVVPSEVFRKLLARALKRSDGAKGGRPPYDPVLIFKLLTLQALYNLSDGQAPRLHLRAGREPFGASSAPS